VRTGQAADGITDYAGGGIFRNQDTHFLRR
jgi:hypothetical protein